MGIGRLKTLSARTAGGGDGGDGQLSRQFVVFDADVVDQANHVDAVALGGRRAQRTESRDIRLGQADSADESPDAATRHTADDRG